MESGNLLPNLQQTANFVCPVREESSPRPSLLTLILFSFLSQDHPIDLFPLVFPSKSMYTFLLSLTCAACPSRLILMYEIAQTDGQEEGLRGFKFRKAYTIHFSGYAFIEYVKDLGIFMRPLCSRGWGLSFEWKTKRKYILK